MQAQIALSDLRKCSDRSDKSAKKNASEFQITLLFGHAHTAHNAVKYISVYVNIDNVAIVVPWV